MRLPAERREWFEALCRTGAFLLLGFLVFQKLLPKKEEAPERIRTARLADLPALTRKLPSREIHFALTGTPGSSERAWQNALRSAGSRISWSGIANPIAVSAKPAASPTGGYVVNSYSAAPSSVTIRDAISIIDSTPPRAHFAAVSVAAASGNVSVSSGIDSASVALNDSVLLRPVLVIGRAGWETKFVLAALEESGWKTSALIFIAPSITTSQGQVASIDTAHYSAVVAVDEFAASRARDISAFVGSGGGLILGEAAARAAELSALRVSTGAPAARQNPFTLDTISRGSASFTPLNAKPAAVPLEQRGRAVAVAALRVGFGRVAQHGYTDTWRWRMQGTPQSLVDHRDWWSGLISQVAYAPRVFFVRAPDDRAPYADLVRIAGNPTSNAEFRSARINQPGGQLIWFMLLALLLLAEWTSRRLRGAA